MLAFVCLVFAEVGGVAYLQYNLNEPIAHAEVFTYAGKNLTSYISAIALVLIIEVGLCQLCDRPHLIMLSIYLS